MVSVVSTSTPVVRRLPVVELRGNSSAVDEILAVVVIRSIQLTEHMNDFASLDSWIVAAPEGGSPGAEVVRDGHSMGVDCSRAESARMVRGRACCL